MSGVGFFKTGFELLRVSTVERYRFVAELRQHFLLVLMCQLLCVPEQVLHMATTRSRGVMGTFRSSFIGLIGSLHRE